MATFWIKAGVIAICSIIKHDSENPNHKEGTAVQIGIGASKDDKGINADGSVPHIALWDDHGNRIGQFKGDANGHLKGGSPSEIFVEHSQNGGERVSPFYLSLVAMESDAICVSTVSAAGNGVEWGWTGDIAKMCGNADWYPSSTMVGDGTSQPACVWIDKDHTAGLHASGFSLHMPDFAASDGRQRQLSENIDTNCKSGPRMTFWYDVLPDDIPPFFDPPLEYTPDGADQNPERVITRQSNLYPSDPKLRRHARDLTKRNANLKPEHLVISDSPHHSAQEVCEDPNSLGWDFVSTSEGIYCDISERKWWYLCSDRVHVRCFDLKTQQLIGVGGTNSTQSTKRDSAIKSYQTTEHWRVPGRPSQ